MDDETIPVCGGTFEALDLHANLVRDAMLLEGQDRIVDYSIGDQDFVLDACEVSSIGCAPVDTGQVFTSQVFHQHEIVHAVRSLDPKIGHHSIAFEEGLAAVFGADFFDTTMVLALNALEMLQDADLSGPEDADRAGRLVAIVLERYGADSFRRFDLSSRTEDESSAFVGAFDETLEDFAVVADAAPLCGRSQWWQPLLECSGEPIDADPETGKLTFTGDLSCGDSEVQGPVFEMMRTSRHFRVAEPTSEILYEFEMPEDATLEIVECHLGCPDRFTYLGGQSDLGSVSNGIPRLEPGEYFLRITRPVSDDNGWFEIVL